LNPLTPDSAVSTTALSSEGLEQLQKLLLFDPWLFSTHVCGSGEGFVERFHRPLLYFLTGHSRLLASSVLTFDSEVTRQIKSEMERLGVMVGRKFDYQKLDRHFGRRSRTNARVSRAMAKTTLNLRGILHAATEDPDISIGVASKSDAAAQKLMGALGRFVGSPAYRALFPQRVPQKNYDQLVTLTRIWLNGRTNSTTEWTIEGRGINSQWTLAHYNFISADDIVGTESGEASNDDAIRWLAAIGGISMPDAFGGTRQDFVGTIYGVSDDHAYISSAWHTPSIIVPIWVKSNYSPDNVMTDGVPTLPEWYPIEKIREKREETISNEEEGLISWLQNFELCAHVTGAGLFSRDAMARQRLKMVQRGNSILYARPKAGLPPREPISSDNWVIVDPHLMPIYMAIDQSVSLAKGADSWAIAVVGFDNEGHVYIFDVVKGKGYNQMLDMIRPMYNRWVPVKIGMDTSATQSMTLEWMQRSGEFMDMAGILCGVQSNNRAKDDRVRAFLAARVQNGTAWISPRLDTFQQEALTYLPGPKAKDDQLDAVSMAIQIGLPSSPIQSDFDDSDGWGGFGSAFDRNGVPNDSWLDLV
jgi:hypothetical protein